MKKFIEVKDLKKYLWEEIPLKQSYSRTAPALFRQASNQKSPRQKKKAIKATRRIRTIGRAMVRELLRKMNDKQLKPHVDTLLNTSSILFQQKKMIKTKSTVYMNHTLNVFPKAKHISSMCLVPKSLSPEHETVGLSFAPSPYGKPILCTLPGRYSNNLNELPGLNLKSWSPIVDIGEKKISVKHSSKHLQNQVLLILYTKNVNKEKGSEKEPA